MKGLLKYLWIIFASIALIVLPLLINQCCRFHIIDGIFGEPEGWTILWSTYIGAIVSCLVAYYVLFKQLEQNHKENSDNRKLQIGVIEYQQKTQWLTELKSELYDFDAIFHRSDFDSLFYFFGRTQETVMDHQTQIMDKINEIYTKASSAILAISTLFSENKDSFEMESLAFFNGNIGELYALLDDLCWFTNYFETMSPLVPLSRGRQEYINETNAYKLKEHPHSSKSRRIWDVMESLEYRCDYDAKFIIVNARIAETLNQTDPTKIRKEIISLIEYEQRKINSILKDSNS